MSLRPHRADRNLPCFRAALMERERKEALRARYLMKQPVNESRSQVTEASISMRLPQEMTQSVDQTSVASSRMSSRVETVAT